MNYLLIILGIFGFLKMKSPAEQAEKYAQEAKSLYAEAKYGAGIILLEKAHKLDSSNIEYQCEIANGYINVREFPNAESILKKLQYRNDVTDRVFQLLGRVYKAQQDIEKARLYFIKGLKFFPNSGKLYLEMGALCYYEKNIDQAIGYWKKGTLVEPSFASNYYWLAKHYSDTEEQLWSALYGELFITLEPNTFRSTDMSFTLFNVYKQAFTYTKSNPDGVQFLPYELTEGVFSVPFPTRFVQTMKMARKVTDLGKTDLEAFYGISDIRFDFIEYWHDQRLNQLYPFTQFTFLNELYTLGFWDAYHVWLLLRWNEQEFKFWYKNNKENYENFLLWLKTATVEPDSKSVIFDALKK